MGLIGCASMRGAPGRESAPGRVALRSGAGMTMGSPQEGQLISDPAPELSTASSCSHFGQLNITSINGTFVSGLLHQVIRPGGPRPEENSLVRRGELFDARPYRRGGAGALFDGGEHAAGLSRIVPRDLHAIIQFDPGL